MTIQQLLLSGASPPPLFIDSASFLTTSSSSTVTVNILNSAVAVGDIIVFFASSAGNGNLTWTAPSDITEVRNTGIIPNLFFGYKYATAAGTQSYTFTASKSARLYVAALVYRNISRLTSKYTTSTSQTTQVLDMTGAGGYTTPCTFLAFAASNQNSITWSVTGESPTTVSSFTGGAGGMVLIILREDAVSSTNYALTLGTNFNTFQGMLVSIS